MIELCHMDVRHFVIIQCSKWLHNQMWLHLFDVISLSIMSGCNNMRYKYYRICFGICMQSVTLWGKVVQPFTRHP